MADVAHSTTNITGGHANAVAGGAAGFMSGADKTKLDGIAAAAAALTASAPANVTKDTAAVGVATTAARADHKHDITTAAAGAAAIGDSAAEGTATSLARSDHRHSIAAGAPVATGTANANGSAATFARSDHVHQTGADMGSQTIKTTGKTVLGVDGATGLDTQQPAAVQTTDATVTNIFTTTIPSDSVLRITAMVLAHQTSDGDTATLSRSATFKSNSGTVAQVGTTSDLGVHADAGGSTWAVTIDVSSNTVRVRVTGQAATTIDWKAYIQLAIYGI
jgi:hypothetical protein